jgi:hypothetical protein
MALIRPRLNDHYGLAFTQEEVDFAIPFLDELARAILAERLLPPAATSDAIHAVVAAQNRVNILLTWNCRHLANPHLLAKLRTFMTAHRLVLPEVCTPIEIVGE